MSEQITYMVALDHWTVETLRRYAEAVQSGDEQTIEEAERRAKLAIRGKVLESYHNGQNAAPRGNQRPFRARR